MWRPNFSARPLLDPPTNPGVATAILQGAQSVMHEPKSYIPSCIKRMLLLWHTQLMVYTLAYFDLKNHTFKIEEILILPKTARSARSAPRNEKLQDSFDFL